MRAYVNFRALNERQGRLSVDGGPSTTPRSDRHGLDGEALHELRSLRPRQGPVSLPSLALQPPRRPAPSRTRPLRKRSPGVLRQHRGGARVQPLMQPRRRAASSVSPARKNRGCGWSMPGFRPWGVGEGGGRDGGGLVPPAPVGEPGHREGARGPGIPRVPSRGPPLGSRERPRDGSGFRVTQQREWVERLLRAG